MRGSWTSFFWMSRSEGTAEAILLEAREPSAPRTRGGRSLARARRPPRVELLQGTLDLIVLRVLATMGPQHAYGMAARLEQVAEHPLRLNQGTLYPALVRLEQKGWIRGTWQTTENKREAKYYAITSAGTRALDDQTDRWRRLAGLVDKLLLDEPE